MTDPTTEALTSGRDVLRWPEVYRRVGKSRTQVWRDIQAGKFPAPIQLGTNTVGWYADEIDSWQAARPRAFCKPVPTAPEEVAA